MRDFKYCHLFVFYCIYFLVFSCCFNLIFRSVFSTYLDSGLPDNQLVLLSVNFTLN